MSDAEFEIYKNESAQHEYDKVKGQIRNFANKRFKAYVTQNEINTKRIRKINDIREMLDKVDKEPTLSNDDKIKFFNAVRKAVDNKLALYSECRIIARDIQRYLSFLLNNGVVSPSMNYNSVFDTIPIQTPTPTQNEVMKIGSIHLNTPEQVEEYKRELGHPGTPNSYWSKLSRNSFPNPPASPDGLPPQVDH